MRAILFLVIFQISGFVAADVCKWRDSSGHLQYGDKAPQGINADCGQAKELPKLEWSNQTLEDSCSAEFRACVSQEYGCISLGLPEKTATCDSACQENILRKLHAAKIPTNFHPNINSPSQPRSCVGFRTDLGGTEKGAQCIATLLGYELKKVGCNEDGWPYNVRTE